MGLSSICNIVAAIKTAKTLGLGASQALITVATDGAALYTSEYAKAKTKHFGAGFGAAQAASTYATHITQANTQHVLPLTEVERRRIFNLGYFTWVEQRGIAGGLRGPTRPGLLAWPARLAAGLGCADQVLQPSHRHGLSTGAAAALQREQPHDPIRPRLRGLRLAAGR
jgi:hypothetical protein